MKYTNLFSCRDKFNLTTTVLGQYALPSFLATYNLPKLSGAFIWCFFSATCIFKNMLLWDSHLELGWVIEYKMYTLQTGFQSVTVGFLQANQAGYLPLKTFCQSVMGDLDTVKAAIDEYPDFPKKGILFQDIFGIFR